jgi:hypothetical protein
VWVAIMKRMMVNNSININKTKRHEEFDDNKVGDPIIRFNKNVDIKFSTHDAPLEEP